MYTLSEIVILWCGGLCWQECSTGAAISLLIRWPRETHTTAITLKIHRSLFAKSSILLHCRFTKCKVGCICRHYIAGCQTPLGYLITSSSLVLPLTNTSPWRNTSPLFPSLFTITSVLCATFAPPSLKTWSRRPARRWFSSRLDYANSVGPLPYIFLRSSTVFTAPLSKTFPNLTLKTQLLKLLHFVIEA